MRCPRDETELTEEYLHGIEVDHCFTCHGRWLDHEQLDQLEATRAVDEEHRRGMIEYAQRESELACPICGEQMTAFNYRGYNVELDTCSQEHGFWLDAGDEGRVQDIIDKRVKDLQRAKSAEAAWGDFLDGLRGGSGGTAGSGSAWDTVRSFFGGRR